jgi:hypothetical protein
MPCPSFLAGPELPTLDAMEDRKDSWISTEPRKDVGLTVEHLEVELEELDIQECTLFACYGTNKQLGRWFEKSHLKWTVHMASKPRIFLHDEDDKGPNCSICQDTAAGCYLYITLPCCHQEVGDECLLNWLTGGDFANTGRTGESDVATYNCPCCRKALIVPARTVSFRLEEENDDELRAAIAESRAFIVAPPPPPTSSSSGRKKLTKRRKDKGRRPRRRVRMPGWLSIPAMPWAASR